MEDIAGVLGNPRYHSGARHIDEGTVDPQEFASKERGGADAISEAVRIGIQGTKRVEAQLPPEVGSHVGGVVQEAQSGGTSFAAATPAGPVYDDGQAIQEGDIVADVNQCLAEVRSITESGVIINVPAVGLREVVSMQGCTLKGRKK